MVILPGQRTASARTLAALDQAVVWTRQLGPSPAHVGTGVSGPLPQLRPPRDQFLPQFIHFPPEPHA